MMTELFRKENVNLNTVVAIVGFLGMFASIIVTWSNVQFKLEQAQDWQTRHEEVHKAQQEENAARWAAFVTRLDSVQTAVYKMDQYDYKIAQLEKGQDGIDLRISRISESYNNQFVEFRTQLQAISIQLAIANDVLKRMEAVKPTGVHDQ